MRIRMLVTCPGPISARLILLALLSLACAGVQGGIYKWVDASGRVQFSDHPPVSGEAESVRLGRINTFEGVRVEDHVDDRRVAPKPAKRPSVVMYGASWCGVCRRARRFFQDQGIPFQEHDIEQDKSAKREFDRMKGTGVPIILVGGKRMNGFSAGRFMALYSR